MTVRTSSAGSSRVPPESVKNWRRMVSFCSLLLVTGLIEIYLWWGKFQYAHSLLLLGTALLGSAVVLFNHWFHQDSLRRIGWNIDNWKAALRHYGLVTVIAAGITAALGLVWGSLTPVTLVGALSYLGWALVQQHLLQNFYHLRISQLLTHTSGARVPAGGLLAALVFALLHWPNYPLVVLTLVGGLLWCFLFIRTPSLWGAAASQVVLTLTLMLFFKFSFLRQFEVGAPGLRFDYFGEGVRVAAGHSATGQVRIGTLPAPDRGHPSLVRIFDVSGTLQMEWEAFPEYDFSGELAIGRIGSAGGDMVAVSPGPGYSNPPRIRLFQLSGELVRTIELPAFPDHQGAWVSIACGRLYAAPGPGPQSPQTLLELTAEGSLSRRWDFPDLPLRNGLRGTAVCADSPNHPPSSLMLWGTDLATNPSTLFLYNAETGRVSKVETLRTTFGVQLTPMTLEGQPVVAVSPGPLKGHPAVVQIQTLDGEFIRHLTFSEDPGNYGSTLATVDLEGDGIDELVLGEGTGPGRGFQVQIRTAEGHLIGSWEAYREGDFR